MATALVTATRNFLLMTVPMTMMMMQMVMVMASVLAIEMRRRKKTSKHCLNPNSQVGTKSP